MKKIKLFLLLFILCNSAAYSEDKLASDFTETQLQDIAEKFECVNPKSPNAELGCQILKEFSKASSPNPTIGESLTLGGRRWVGAATIWGPPGKNEIKRPSPYLNLLLFCAQYTRDFHQKIYYPNGQAIINIGAENQREIEAIEKAVASLKKETVDRSNAAIQFAEKYDASNYYDDSKKTQGKSFINGARTFIRQNGDYLYFIDINKEKKGKETYLLAVVSLNNELAH